MTGDVIAALLVGLFAGCVLMDIRWRIRQRRQNADLARIVDMARGLRDQVASIQRGFDPNGEG